MLCVVNSVKCMTCPVVPTFRTAGVSGLPSDGWNHPICVDLRFSYDADNQESEVIRIIIASIGLQNSKPRRFL